MSSPRQKNSFIAHNTPYYMDITIRSPFNAVMVVMRAAATDNENCAALTFVAVPRLAE